MMMQSILDFAQREKDALKIVPGNVLEVGSYNVNGSARSVFEADCTSYIGVDIQDGPGVDVVCDGLQLLERFPDQKFDTIICMETLEHTIMPWEIVSQMKKLLAPKGYLFISTPTFGFPLHRFPLDCYRFGEDAYRYWMFKGLALLSLQHVNDGPEHPAIVAVGYKYD